jgi:hypothetical protein
VGRPRTRWEEDNDIPVNWAAIVAALAGIAALVGLAVLLEIT